MFLEPTWHNSNLVTRSRVLLEHSISIWEDTRPIQEQVVRNDVKILHNVQELLNCSLGARDQQNGPTERPLKHNTVTTGLCMTFCTQLTLTLLSAVWISNCYSSDLSIPLHWSLIQSRCSWALLAKMLCQQMQMSGSPTAQPRIQ